MNGGGDYTIANSDSFDTIYRESREFFEIYSLPIRTRYGQVHWKNHGDLLLPVGIIERFKNGKVMAVTGYEVDQVMIKADGDEVSVPITWAYNHHYTLFIFNSNKTRIERVPIEELPSSFHTMSHGSDHVLLDRPIGTIDPLDTIPKSHFFSEGNGGEMRKSYHGYPKRYAQLLESPDRFTLTPMQIDTWNRREMSNHTFVRGPVPLSAAIPKRIPPEAPYSPLLECPCTNRLNKTWSMTYTIHATDCIPDGISNASECLDAAMEIVPYSSGKVVTKHVHTRDLPSGCSLQVQADGGLTTIWNTLSNHGDTKPLLSDSEKVVGVASTDLVNVTISMDPLKLTALITLQGPSEKWFGIGLGTSSMCLERQADACPTGGPYAIIATGNGVEERKLQDHGPGTVLDPSITVISDSVNNNITRTVVLARSLVGATDRYFSLDPTQSTVPIIVAVGCGMEFVQHCGHVATQLEFLPVGVPQQVCRAGIAGMIGQRRFRNQGRCLPFPRSDLLAQGNPTCKIETYQGGLLCCVHDEYLLDKEQEAPWKDQVLEYRMKFRFYFEEHQSATAPALPNSLIRLYWQTESSAGEYDIPKSSTGVHEITARWKVVDMLHDCSILDAGYCTGNGSTNPNITEGIQLIYAGPHCHAPTCLSMELWNMDTGELLCGVSPYHGTGSGVFDEAGFLSIPPCLWGSKEEGLISPVTLPLGTTLMSIKRCNSTLPHTGEMASWQMRGVLVPRSAPSLDVSITAVTEIEKGYE